MPHLPLARERPPLNDPDWGRRDDVERFALRWVWRNRSIRRHCATSDAVTLTVRYEDLFDQGKLDVAVLARTLATIGVEDPRALAAELRPGRVNATPESRRDLASPDAKAVMDICADEAGHYGYG